MVEVHSTGLCVLTVCHVSSKALPLLLTHTHADNVCRHDSAMLLTHTPCAYLQIQRAMQRLKPKHWQMGRLWQAQSLCSAASLHTGFHPAQMVSGPQMQETMQAAMQAAMQKAITPSVVNALIQQVLGCHYFCPFPWPVLSSPVDGKSD